MSTAASKNAAYDASVSDAATDQAAYRQALADDAEGGIQAVKSQIKDLQASLKVREAEATRLRAEAKEN